MLYEDDEPIQDKIEAIATRVYGATDVYFYPEAEKKIGQFTRDGLGPLPDLHGQDAPVAVVGPRAAQRARRTSALPVRDIRAYTGAGWLVPLCGDITQMPGLGKTPAALNVDIDADGRTVGPVLSRARNRASPRSPTSRSVSCSTQVGARDAGAGRRHGARALSGVARGRAGRDGRTVHTRARSTPAHERMDEVAERGRHAA